MLRALPDVLLGRAGGVRDVRAKEMRAVLPGAHADAGGKEFCVWARTGPIFNRCFVCRRNVPFDRCMATTICLMCERGGPPKIKA